MKSLFIDRFPGVRQLSVRQERHAGRPEIQAGGFGRDAAPALGRAEEAVSPRSGRQHVFYSSLHFVPCMHFVWRCCRGRSSNSSSKTRGPKASARSSCFKSGLQCHGALPSKGNPRATRLAWGCRVQSSPGCCLKMCFRCIQTGFLLALVGICYLNAIRRLFCALLITPQILLITFSKKNTCPCTLFMEQAGLSVLFFSQHTRLYST